MTRSRLALVVAMLAVGCGAGTQSTAAERPVAAPPTAAPGAALSLADRCEMIEAAFRVEALRRFACGTAATRVHRILVDVDMAPRFTRHESCASRVFAIYRAGEPTNTDAVLQLSIGPRDRTTWEFGAVFFDPPNSPDDHPVGGGFDDANYYCVFMGGRLSRANGGWRAWVEPLR